MRLFKKHKYLYKFFKKKNIKKTKKIIILWDKIFLKNIYFFHLFFVFYNFYNFIFITITFYTNLFLTLDYFRSIILVKSDKYDFHYLKTLKKLYLFQLINININKFKFQKLIDLDLNVKKNFMKFYKTATFSFLNIFFNYYYIYINSKKLFTNRDTNYFKLFNKGLILSQGFLNYKAILDFKKIKKKRKSNKKLLISKKKKKTLITLNYQVRLVKLIRINNRLKFAKNLYSSALLNFIKNIIFKKKINLLLMNKKKIKFYFFSKSIVRRFSFLKTLRKSKKIFLNGGVRKRKKKSLLKMKKRGVFRPYFKNENYYTALISKKRKHLFLPSCVVTIKNRNKKIIDLQVLTISRIARKNKFIRFVNIKRFRKVFKKIVSKEARLSLNLYFQYFWPIINFIKFRKFYYKGKKYRNKKKKKHSLVRLNIKKIKKKVLLYNIFKKSLPNGIFFKRKVKKWFFYTFYKSFYTKSLNTLVFLLINKNFFKILSFNIDTNRQKQYLTETKNLMFSIELPYFSSFLIGLFFFNKLLFKFNFKTDYRYLFNLRLNLSIFLNYKFFLKYILKKNIMISKLNNISVYPSKLLELPINSNYLLENIYRLNKYFNNYFLKYKFNKYYFKLYNDNSVMEINIQRTRFKPGYIRIWLNARADFQIGFNLKFKYQHRLTKFLLKFRRTVSSFFLITLSLSLHMILIFSQFLFLYTTLKNYIQKNLIFVNGFAIQNENFFLKKNDLIQLLIFFQYYLFSKLSYNLVIKKYYKIKLLFFYIISKASLNFFKTKRSTMPNKLSSYRYLNYDIPLFLEVDYISLSILIIYEPYLNSLLDDYLIFYFKLYVFNMYNWKYIT